MTNEEYQRQAAERSRQVDEARRRQSLEDFNRSERDRAARNAQAQKENYSRSLGSRGITPPLLGPGVDRAAYNRARQAYEANQRSLQQLKRGFSSVGSNSYSGSSGGSGKAKSAGAGLVVLLIVIAVIVYSGSGGSSRNSQNTDNAGSSAAPQSDSGTGQPSPYIPKPSPDNQDQNQGQYRNPPPQALPAQQSEPQSVTTAAPGSDGTVPEPPPADANAPAAPPPPVSITRMANRDGIKKGCEGGQLTIDPSTIAFTCPSDPSKDVNVGPGQVVGVDNNGILVFPKQKYHFDIDGMSKQEVHDLFAQWLDSARKAAAPSEN